MSKKIFALLLVAVFVLAQFGTAAAATVAGEVSVDALDTFHYDGNIDIDFDVVNMNPGTKYIHVWSRENDGGPNNLWDSADCQTWGSTTAASLTNATWSFSDNWYVDNEVVEFYVTVDSAATCAAATDPATAAAAMTSTFIDDNNLTGFIANPPSVEQDSFYYLEVACNTFEMWGMIYDEGWNGPGFSGLADWDAEWYGTVIAPPAPEGASEDLLSWMYSFPAGSVTGSDFDFWVDPYDVAGNGANMQYGYYDFRWDSGNGAIDGVLNTAEKADCEDFTDVAGHSEEAYIRYLAELGLLAGNPDGSYAPNNTLTRAEASVLFETANGYDAASLPTAAPSEACTFTDVADTDWFAGWVWQACDDGFMNGVGGGLFDPSNTLTRGQVVTVFHNMVMNGMGNDESFLDDGTYIGTILNDMWGAQYREVAYWTDVALGDYFFMPAVYAYGIGVADGTTDTTFSPNTPITRGLFAKWMYRALSRVW